MRSNKRSSTGAIVYSDYRENFVVWPGRETALHAFVHQRYGGRRHKVRHAKSSNSEDALTWSCFDTLDCLTGKPKTAAMKRLWEDAFDKISVPPGFLSGKIFTGKRYGKSYRRMLVTSGVRRQRFELAI